MILPEIDLSINTFQTFLNSLDPELIINGNSYNS